MNGSFVTRFFGGSPGRVIFQLVVVSFVVGIVLSALGVSPYDIVDGLVRLAERIYDMGFGAIETVFRYFLLGAVIVVPIWLVSRMIKVGRRNDGA